MSLKAEVVLDLPEGRALFALRGAQVESLERACGKVGVGLIMQRVTLGSYFMSDLRNVIHYGLMGGGKTNAQAEEITDFLMRQPLEAGPTSPHSIAKAVLGALFVGLEDISPGEQKAGT